MKNTMVFIKTHTSEDGEAAQLVKWLNMVACTFNSCDMNAETGGSMDSLVSRSNLICWKRSCLNTQ